MKMILTLFFLVFSSPTTTLFANVGDSSAFEFESQAEDTRIRDKIQEGVSKLFGMTANSFGFYGGIQALYSAIKERAASTTSSARRHQLILILFLNVIDVTAHSLNFCSHSFSYLTSGLGSSFDLGKYLPPQLIFLFNILSIMTHPANSLLVKRGGLNNTLYIQDFAEVGTKVHTVYELYSDYGWAGLTAELLD